MNLYKVDTKFVFCFVCCFGFFFCIRMFYWIYFCRKVKTFKWYVCAYSIALVFSVKQLSIWKKIRRKTRSDIVIDNREVSFRWSHRVFWYEVCPKLLCLSQFCDFWKKNTIAIDYNEKQNIQDFFHDFSLGKFYKDENRFLTEKSDIWKSLEIPRTVFFNVIIHLLSCLLQCKNPVDFIALNWNLTSYRGIFKTEKLYFFHSSGMNVAFAWRYLGLSKDLAICSESRSLERE